MDEGFAFCKVTWLRDYRGESHDVTRYRNIQYKAGVEDEREGAEAYLFQPYRGICYGYVHLGRTDAEHDDTIRSINLKQLGGSNRADCVQDVRIIWIAARIDQPGICVVGEYRKATVYRSAEAAVGKRPWGWNISAAKGDVTIVPEDKRVLLGGVPLRQGNLWYAKAPGDSLVRSNALSHIRRYGAAVK